MAEKKNAEEVVVEEHTPEQAAQAFAEGFAEPSEPTETQQPAAEATTTEEPPNAEEPPAEPAPAEPKYVQLTEDQLSQIMATVQETASVKKGLDSLAGTVGNVRKALDQVRSQTPVGVNVEITDEDFAELAEDFPELAGHTRKSFERILKKANVQGTGAPATQAIDEEAVRNAALWIVHNESIENLNDMHPGWQDTVASAEYQGWLAKQSEDYQAKIKKTQSADMLGRSIDRFNASKAPPAPQPRAPQRPQAVVRRQTLAAAVQPKGNGATPPAPRPPTPEENFRAGFNS